MCVATLTKKTKRLLYSDSYNIDKNLGWKENGDVKSRRELYQYVYNELIPKLFSEFKEGSPIIIAGPSNEEVEHIKSYVEKFKIIIFEPDSERVKELKEELRNVEIIEDYTFNLKKYIKKNSIIGAICLNILNWVPTNPLSLLNGLYSAILPNGKVILSVYIDILQDSKDRKYLIETPKYLKDLLENYSLKNFTTYYFDSNGILKLYVLDKNGLKKILKELERKITELRKEFKFFFKE